MAEKFCFSTNQENYEGEFETREAAVLAAIEQEDLEEGRAVWTGVVVPTDLLRLVPTGSWLIEHMEEAAFEEVGEAAEGWLDTVSKEDKDDLRKRMAEAVQGWLDADPARSIHFWGVAKVQPHLVTPELIAQA